LYYLSGGGSARDKKQLDVETMLAKDARFIGDPYGIVRSTRAIDYANSLEWRLDLRSCRIGDRDEKQKQADR
jgi:hypothetical protein